MNCPCGSTRPFDQCCGPFLSGDATAPTAEALMRSRYTAYTRHDIDYIGRTLAPESSHDFDAAAATTWATQAQWLGLEILATERGREDDVEGVVEFVAAYKQNGATVKHRERSTFRKSDEGVWYFVEGAAQAAREPAHSEKIGRNDPCPCGSGKKYKKCCGA
jgi:SEC-C motif-containing protein